MLSASSPADLVSVSNARFEDIDAQAEQLAGYDQRYQQLSRGRFEGHFAKHSFGARMSINVESTNQVLSQWGNTPRDHHALCFLADDSGPVLLDGVALTADTAMFWGGSHAYQACMTENSAICVIDIAIVDDGRESPRASSSRIVAGRDRISAMRRSISAGVAEFLGNHDAKLQARAVNEFSVAVEAEVSQLVCGETDENPRIGASHRMRLFRLARDMAHSHMADGISVTELCTATGTSRRTLENVFQATVRVSPMRYLRAIQLNQVRRALLHHESAQSSLGDLAARCGIWHLSRFAREYRETFGELPSHTRNRTLRLSHSSSRGEKNRK